MADQRRLAPVQEAVCKGAAADVSGRDGTRWGCEARVLTSSRGSFDALAVYKLTKAGGTGRGFFTKGSASRL